MADIDFLHLDAVGMNEFANEKASEIGLLLPDAYRPAVLETLNALRTHAAILASRLEMIEQHTAGTADS